MHMACNDAQIREEVVTRPDGFNTLLVKGGKNFSGGQIQRMEIATALTREPVILIMDEATSALDAETEVLLMERLTSSLSDHTMIFITHRDRIIDYCGTTLRL